MLLTPFVIIPKTSKVKLASLPVKITGQLLDGIPTIFSKETQHNNKTEEYEELIAMLYQKIGQLEVELEWLKKNLFGSKDKSKTGQR
jgi:hypothetical protein